LNLCKDEFTLGVSKNVQPKSSIPIGAKVEITPKGLPDAKYPLTSPARRWFHLSFCIPFSPLHSSAREGFFFYIYYIKKVKKATNFKTLQQNKQFPARPHCQA
jgi:hypothetical protein